MVVCNIHLSNLHPTLTKQIKNNFPHLFMLSCSTAGRVLLNDDFRIVHPGCTFDIGASVSHDVMKIVWNDVFIFVC